MTNRYSIAEARNHFAALIRGVEVEDGLVEVTRHGEPVAVIMAIDEYRRLASAAAQRDFWSTYQAFRAQWAGEEIDNEGDVWEGVRDQEPAREENPWG